MKKQFEIFLNGQHVTILWAASPESAVAEAKRILFWDQRGLTGELTATPWVCI